MGCRCYKTAVFKPPDLVCRRTYILILILSFYLLRFSPPIIFELAERNSTNIGHMLGSNCDLKTHVKNLGYPPTNQGPKNHLLGPTSQFNGKFNGLYLRNETRYRQSVRYVDNSTRGLLHRPEISWTLVHKRLQTRPAFYPTSVNSAFCFITNMLRRRRSANQTLPNGIW